MAMVEVTLQLPAHLVEHAARLGISTQRDIETVLIDALELIWLTLENSPELRSIPVEELSDAEVLSWADLKMDPIQNQRLGHLQEKGKVSGLAEAERYELLALLQIYQQGQLRKSEGLAEAVRRGLRYPLPA